MVGMAHRSEPQSAQTAQPGQAGLSIGVPRTSDRLGEISLGADGAGGGPLDALQSALGHWAEDGPPELAEPGAGSEGEDAAEPGAEANEPSEIHERAQDGVEGSCAPLPYLDQVQEAFGAGHDLSSLRTRTGGPAAAMGQRIGAQHYAFGNRIAFGKEPSLHDAAHEAAHAVMQRAGIGPSSGVGQAGDMYEEQADAIADRVVAGKSAADLLPPPGAARGGQEPRAVQRKELPKGTKIASASDWTVEDREKTGTVWKKACEYNLNNKDSKQYRRIPERRDFYRWFYVKSTEMGFKTRWALAASLVADGANQVANPSGLAVLGETVGRIGPELQAMMRTGNQVIFDNVFPKLHELIKSDPSKMNQRQALEWDMQTLSEEQQLVQPLYNQMSKEAKGQMESIARKDRLTSVGAFLTGGDNVQALYNGKGQLAAKGGKIPGFAQPNLENSDDRWMYGMKLGKQFAPEDTGFNPATNRRPDAGSGYRDGTELAQVNSRPNLHKLDAYLQRQVTGDILEGILNQLTRQERIEMTYDEPPDGGRYSQRLASWLSISESEVKNSITKDPKHIGAAQAFMARWKAEHEAVEFRLKYQYPMYPGFP